MTMKGAALAAILSTLSLSAYAGQDWTTIQGNGTHTGYVAIKSKPENIRVLWTKELHVKQEKQDTRHLDWVLARGIVSAGDKVYVAVSEYYDSKKSFKYIYPTTSLMALDVDTGATKWEKFVGYNDDIAPLTFAAGRLIAGVYRNDFSVLHAYLPETGQLDYSLPMSTGFGFYGPQAIGDDVYVRGGDIRVSDAALTKINARTGRVDWSRPYDSEFTMPGGNSKYLIQAEFTGLDVLDPATGKKILHIDSAGGWLNLALEQSLSVVIDEKRDTAYYVYRNDRVENGWGTLYAFDLKQNNIKWSSPGGTGQPVLAGDEIIQAGFSPESHFQLRGVNPDTGALTWQWKPKKDGDYFDGWQQIIATKDMIFAHGSGTGTIGISRKTHEVVWRYAKGGEMIIAGNKLFILSATQLSAELTAVALN